MQKKNFVHKEFIEWEEKNNLYSVKYNNELVWSFLRMDFRFWIIKKIIGAEKLEEEIR